MLVKYVARFSFIHYSVDATLRNIVPTRYHKAIPHIFDLIANIYLLWRLYTIPQEHLQLQIPNDFYQTERVSILDDHMNLELAWYISTSIFILYSGKRSLSMLLHHMIAIGFIKLSMVANVTKLGIHLIRYMNISNPFLHLTRTFHSFEMKTLSTLSFLVFFTIYTYFRIVSFPISYAWFVFDTVGHYWRVDRPILFMASCTNIGLIYVVQLYWYWKMVGIIMRL